MLKKYSQFFLNLLILFDALVVSISWLFSYYLRFSVPLVPVYKGVPPFSLYYTILPLVVLIWLVVFNAFGLYRPMRVSARLREVTLIIKASTLALLIFMALTFVFRQYEYSRVVFLSFWAINIASLSIGRMVIREGLRSMRKRGFNLRYALMVGSGSLARSVAEKIEEHPELGLKIKGLLAPDPSSVGQKIDGLSIVGTYEDVCPLLDSMDIDQLLIALPIEEHHKLEGILKDLDQEMVDIKVIPDLYQFVTIRGAIEEFDGIPIVSLQDTPWYGWNRALKRLMDVLFSLILIVVLSPLLGLIALLIKLTSPGPVLFEQERVGLDGEVFQMLKFRTMRMDAEGETGPVWAQEGDPRCTPLGSWLRGFSLDELPQLFNVLKGEMSLVGPRPERSVFIQEFKKEIPKYMLRHKMKAGMTGWAQVHGLRGNTSLEERIKYDIHYIENWSILLDLRILLKTLFTFARGAY